MRRVGASKFANLRLACVLAASLFAAVAPALAQTLPGGLSSAAALALEGYPLPAGLYAPTPSSYALVPGAFGVLPKRYILKGLGPVVPLGGAPAYLWHGPVVRVPEPARAAAGSGGYRPAAPGDPEAPGGRLAAETPPPSMHKTEPIMAAAEEELARAWNGVYFSLDFFATHSNVRDHELTPVGGQTTLEIRHEDDQVAGNSFAVGYALEDLPLRVEVEAGVRYRFDLNYRAKSPTNANLVTGYGANLATLFAMFNGYYDFDLGSDWTPYLGGGIGWAHHWADSTRFNVFTDIEVKDDFYKDNLSWSLMGGVLYDWSPSWRIGLEARYVDLGDVEIGPFSGGDKIAAEYRSFDFILGLTYAPRAAGRG